MVTSVICLSISCAIILLKEKSNYPDNHLLMTYLVILLFAVMAISIKACGGVDAVLRRPYLVRTVRPPVGAERKRK